MWIKERLAHGWELCWFENNTYWFFGKVDDQDRRYDPAIDDPRYVIDCYVTSRTEPCDCHSGCESQGLLGFSIADQIGRRMTYYDTKEELYKVWDSIKENPIPYMVGVALNDVD